MRRSASHSTAPFASSGSQSCLAVSRISRPISLTSAAVDPVGGQFELGQLGRDLLVLAGVGLRVVDRVVEPGGQPDRVGVVGQIRELVDGLEHLGQVPLVVIVAMLLCVTGQQIIAQRLRVRQQAIPLVAQVHGWESRTGAGLDRPIRGSRLGSWPKRYRLVT